MAAPATGCGSKRGPAESSKEERGTYKWLVQKTNTPLRRLHTVTNWSFPIWKQPRKDGYLKNIIINFNRLQFVTNWIVDILAPKTAERGESDNIRTRVRQARDLPVRGASRPAHETEISSQELLTFASSSHR